jgi:hypothetical protein
MSTDKFNRNNCLQRQSTVIYPIWVCPYFGRGWVGSNVRTCYLRTERKMSRAMWSWTPAHGGQTLFLECRTRGRTPTLSRAFSSRCDQDFRTGVTGVPGFSGAGRAMAGRHPHSIGLRSAFLSARDCRPTAGRWGCTAITTRGAPREEFRPDRAAVSTLVAKGWPACGSQRVNAGYRPDNDNLPPRATPAHPGLLKYRHRSD